MEKSNKNPKYHYLVKLLQEFDLLKSEEAIQEVLEYTRFVREEENDLQKLTYQQNTPLRTKKKWHRK